MSKKKNQLGLRIAAVALVVIFIAGYLASAFFDEATPGFQTEQTTHIDIPFRADGTVTISNPQGEELYRGTIEIASTDQQREQGLMYRDSLGADQGMLFVFPGRSSTGLLDEKHTDTTRHPLHRGKRHDRKYRGKCPAVRRDLPALAGSGAVRTGDSRRDVRCTRHPGGRFGKLDTGLISFRP